MCSFPKTALCAAALALVAPQLSAQEITLKSDDGSVSFDGLLVSASEGHITIRTAVGVMQVPADKVSCSGAGCPQTDVPLADLALPSSDTIRDAFMPLPAEGSAAQ